MFYHLQVFTMYLTSQQNIMRQHELISVTAEPGITGVEPINALPLERVYHCALKSGQGPICLACYANVQGAWTFSCTKKLSLKCN